MRYVLSVHLTCSLITFLARHLNAAPATVAPAATAAPAATIAPAGIVVPVATAALLPLLPLLPPGVCIIKQLYRRSSGILG